MQDTIDTINIYFRENKLEAIILISIIVVLLFILVLPKEYILPAIIISPIPPIP